MKKGVEVVELENGDEIILGGGKELFIRGARGLFPTLLGAELLELRQVAVDMGAVPYVANGADVMGPGVVSADVEIKVGEAVTVVDERHGKTLAVGVAQVPGTEMKAPEGKVVKNVHHVGDKRWRLIREKG
ncbi:MAG TPA: RNA-binding protein [Hadesarchaea archaeon]|nr:RNA-binding protein [Hadesarchaea archaeon]